MVTEEHSPDLRPASAALLRTEDLTIRFGGLTALNVAEATDQNGFVVTSETATKYGLTKLSDLAKPAP